MNLEDLTKLFFFLIYKKVHIVKKVRKLAFKQGGKHYIADWNNIRRLYCDDKSSSLRFGKLTHTAVEPKPLQRQNVSLVLKVKVLLGYIPN